MSDDLLDMSPEDEPVYDAMYEEAKYLVTSEQRASTSWLQRQLKVSYNRAGSLIDALERNGVISEASSVGKRTVHEPAPEKTKRSVVTRGKPVGSPGKANAATVQALLQPVSISFLAQAMKMDRKTVTNKLSGLEPLSSHRGQTPLYDFRQAVRFLVSPKITAEALKKLGTNDLPTALQKDVWDARLKSQKWRANAGELWATEDVLTVLGEAFQRIRSTTQLWIDQVGDNNSLDAEARKELSALVDALQNDLHRTLVKMPEEKQTLSQAGEIDLDEYDDDD